MKRAASVQAAYDAACRRILRKWSSVDAYIRATKFVDGPICFEPNPYPYRGLGRRHWILWSLRPLRNAEIAEILRGWPPHRVQINKRGDQSVPGVWHAHVFFD